MADWHHGYGFPIGGVVATQVEWGDLGGSISPGGVGFDINCGVRALALDITKDDIKDLADFLEGSKDVFLLVLLVEVALILATKTLTNW